jgi:hypothetical protein
MDEMLVNYIDRDLTEMEDEDEASEYSSSDESEGGPLSLLPMDSGMLEELQSKVLATHQTVLASAIDDTLRLLVYDKTIHCKIDCPYTSACYLEEKERPSGRKRHPKWGNKCPIECDMIFRFFYGYIVELEIDKSKLTEIQSAAELAATQVLKRRVDIIIKDQTNGTMLIDQGVAIDKQTGVILTKAEEHPLFRVKRALEQRENEIKKELSATREQNLKLKAEKEAGSRKTASEWLSSIDITEE